jgi:hypothetical protein
MVIDRWDGNCWGRWVRWYTGLRRPRCRFFLQSGEPTVLRGAVGTNRRATNR